MLDKNIKLWYTLWEKKQNALRSHLLAKGERG